MHSDAPTAADTDWRQIVALYDQLLRARARRRSSRSTARSRSPRWTARPPALALVDALDLAGYHLFHAVRADLLRRLGRDAEAAAAYDAAIALTDNDAERPSSSAAAPP